MGDHENQILKTILVAKEFIKRAEATLEEQAEERNWSKSRKGNVNSALRRQSMELTRQLAEYRRS